MSEPQLTSTPGADIDFYAPPVDAKLLQSLFPLTSKTQQAPSCGLGSPSLDVQKRQLDIVQGASCSASEPGNAKKSCGTTQSRSTRPGIGVTKVERKNCGTKFIAEVKWNGQKVFLGSFDTLEKAAEIYDLFIFRKAGTRSVAEHRTNKSWGHYFSVCDLQLHLVAENLSTTWEERYDAYDRIRVQCCVSRYQEHEKDFVTLNCKRDDFNPIRRPFPLYFTEHGIPRESVQHTEALKKQLCQFDPQKQLLPELYLGSYSCVECEASFAAPEFPQQCGTPGSFLSNV